MKMSKLFLLSLLTCLIICSTAFCYAVEQKDSHQLTAAEISALKEKEAEAKDSHQLTPAEINALKEKEAKAKETAENQIVIVNNSGAPIYIYDWDMSLPANEVRAISPLAGPLPNNGTFNVPMKPPANQGTAARRIYISDAHLSGSLENTSTPVIPNAFCPWNDGAVMYSFVEYNYQPASNWYTVDLSYIDEFSYPLTIMFSNVGTAQQCQEGFAYGLTTLSSVVSSLKQQTSFPWSDLVWPLSNPSNPGGASWPDNIYRVIGPDLLWGSQVAGGTAGLTAYAPTPYHNFVSSLPYNGAQLFGSSINNFDGWRFQLLLPAATGYAKALHAAADIAHGGKAGSGADKKGKYGFFTYCKDNTNGEFTDVPSSVDCTVTVYPYNK